MRQRQRYPRTFALPSGSSLLLLTAICAALLSAEPPAGRNALRHFEGQVVKAKTILHHLAAVSPTQDAAQIRVLVEGLLEIAPLPAAPGRSLSAACFEDPRFAAPPAPSALFQRPPPVPAEA